MSGESTSAPLTPAPAPTGPEKRVAIVQSNYIPWKGYFDLVNSVDECILYDDMQYTRRDWRNRNKIKTAAGVEWLTIPVVVKGRFHQAIRDVFVADADWARVHWLTITQSYGRAPGFARFEAPIEEAYRSAGSMTSLSEINAHFLRTVCGLLGIDTHLGSSMDYRLAEGKTERLVDLCRQAGATHYLSGPAARAYIDEPLFAHAGIELSYMDYDDYREYPQPYPPFEHGVSILDLLFSVGDDAPSYLKTLR